MALAVSFDSTITSTFDFKIHEWNNDLSDLQLQIDKDKELLAQYENDKSKTISIGAQIKSEVSSALAELQKTRDDMEKELEFFATGMLNSFLDRAFFNENIATEMFNTIFDPFLQALDPLMNIVGSVGLPEVPIIGNIKNIIQQISKTGQIISKLPKEVREAARKEMAEKKEAEKAAKEARQSGMSYWNRQMDNFKESPFGKICQEIVEIFKQVIEVIMMMCQCAAMAAILMLLEKLKPIIDSLGDIIAIILNVQTVMRMLMYSSAQMIKYFYRVLEEKFTELWGIVQYAIDGGWSMPVNSLISAIHADMICCEFEISSIKNNINKSELERKVEIYEEDIKTSQEEINKINAMIKETEETVYVDGTINENLIQYLKKYKDKFETKNKNAVKQEKETKENITKLDENIKKFETTKTEKYEAELNKRCAEDKALAKNHEEIQNAINNNKNKLEKI